MKMKMTVSDQFSVNLVGVAGSDDIIENAQIIFRIHAPIFVLKEFAKHNLNVIFNETPIREFELEPLFYMPSINRGLVRINDEYSQGDLRVYSGTAQIISGVYEACWTAYKTILAEGVSEEIASLCLPVSIYSKAYVTMGINDMLAFLASKNLNYEYEQIRKLVEKLFENRFPLAYAAYIQRKKEIDNGR
jgi:hypothetical protein